jgi:hypothetical protein
MSRDTRELPAPARSATPIDRERSREQPDARRWSPSERLTLPRYQTRQPVCLDRNRFMLRDSEIDLLSTVGAFRVVAVRDLGTFPDNTTDRDRSHVNADIRSLCDQDLIEKHALVINGRPEPAVVLTNKGRELLERFRRPRDDRDAPEQQFYAGLVKPRELAHDAQLYRMFEVERSRLDAEGATVERVVLDYELKADYHAYVYAQERAGVNTAEARRTFAEEHSLPFGGQHIHFPDLRVEYRTDDGSRECRDLELATEHYSRSQLSGKQSAGFRVYRAAGASAARRGGHPADPHLLEWLA